MVALVTAIDTDGSGVTVIVTGVLDAQPVADITPVTVYVVVLAGLATTCVPVVWFKPVAGDQLKVLADGEDTFSVVDPLVQIDVAPEVMSAGIGLTVMVLLTDVEQLF